LRLSQCRKSRKCQLGRQVQPKRLQILDEYKMYIKLFKIGVGLPNIYDKMRNDGFDPDDLKVSVFLYGVITRTTWT
jgi:hypothetical protein